MTSNWPIVRLGDVCDIARGGSPRPIQSFLTDAPDGVNWIKISDATASGKYIFKTEEKIKPEGVKRSRLVRDGDFLLSNSMSFGRPYIMRTTGCIHDGWLVLSDKSRTFDQDFLYYFLGSGAAYKQFDELAAGSTVRNLNIELAKKVRIPVPPYSEQQRIAAILDEAFEGLTVAAANAERNLKNARELFDSYLNSVFTQKGEGWMEGQLGSIGGDVFTGPFGSLLHKSDYVRGGVPLVNPAHIIDGKIVPDNEKTVDMAVMERLINYRLRYGDIVIGRRGEIGRCAVVTRQEEGWLCGTGSFVIRPFDGVNPWFLAHLLRSKYYRQVLETLSTGATMLNLSNTSLSNLGIRMPDLRRQQTTLDAIDPLYSEVERICEIYSQKLISIPELRQSILHKAFSGELTTRPSTTTLEAVA